MLRRRTKQTQSLEERLSQHARRLRDEAKALPPGPARDAALRKAKEALRGSRVAEWLTLPDEGDRPAGADQAR
jgi:hypothetical protein